MARFPVTITGIATTRGGKPDNSLPGGEGPVDPDYGIDVGHRPDQGLPGMGGPVDPGYGFPLPPVIDNGLPPVPGHPDHGLPTYPVRPDNSLPHPPSVWPKPPMPPTVWPPLPPIYPSHPIYPTPPNTDRPDQGLPVPPVVDNTLPPHVDQGLPGDQPHPDQGLPGAGGTPSHPIYLPGHVWPPLPPSITGNIIAFCWIVGVGYRWAVLTPESGRPTHPIAPTPEPK